VTAQFKCNVMDIIHMQSLYSPCMLLCGPTLKRLCNSGAKSQRRKSRTRNLQEAVPGIGVGTRSPTTPIEPRDVDSWHLSPLPGTIDNVTAGWATSGTYVLAG